MNSFCLKRCQGLKDSMAYHYLHFPSLGDLPKAVKTFLSSLLIMNSRQLWNLHQRHKFLRVEASRDILKFRVSDMAFPRAFN